MTMMCREFRPSDAARWDNFVRSHPQGSFFHLSAWARVISRAFGHRPHYLLLERDGEIAGVLPLGLQSSLLFGRSLISVPMCVYGGTLALDVAAEQALTAAAEALMQQLGVKVMEWRTQHAGDVSVNWQVRDDLYATFRRPITADDAVNMKAIPRKQRAMVRKGIDRGLTSVVHRDPQRLHRIYAESVRNLGTPVFSWRYFAILLEEFGDATDIVSIMEGNEDRAAVLNFYWRDEVLPYYGGGTTLARGCAANDFMYWEVTRYAAARGCRVFDFGRSKAGTGAYAFKKNWGFEPTPLPYRYCLAPGATVPNNNPLNPKFRVFIAAWKRLPLPVANLLGPFIVRGLG